MAERVVPEPERRRRRPTRQGTVLSHRLIVDTALGLVDQHGAEALSVRRLGAALGADPTTIYRYFRNTDALLLAIADELLGQAQDGWTASGDWRTDLRDLCLRLHAAYARHPQAAALAAHRTTGRAHEIRAVETLLQILRSAGFPDAEAVAIYHALADQALAFAALHAAALALPAATLAADHEVWQETYARLGADEHPNIAAVMPLLETEMQRSGFPQALELLLDAAAARLAQHHVPAPDA
jgi:AcrR family transcriptional regulator